ncbi:MAG: hypothetical protein CMP22_07185 [Rickettsiales bacterium]|nr:hypothetical protein [Rickettsiales bacterium]
MIFHDIRNLKFQIIDLANKHGGAVTFGSKDLKTLVHSLHDIEQRVIELEKGSINKLARPRYEDALCLDEYDNTNVLVFPQNNNRKGGVL